MLMPMPHAHAHAHAPQGNKELKAEITERTGLNVATGAEACKAALMKFGAKRIAIITPYQEIGDRNVVKFFSEIGIYHSDHACKYARCIHAYMH